MQNTHEKSSEKSTKVPPFVGGGSNSYTGGFIVKPSGSIGGTPEMRHNVFPIISGVVDTP